MANYVNEREGQIDFYKTFLPAINPEISVEELLSDDNDGVLNGNILEFKMNVSDLNAVLFQCIKYLSALRCKGKPVPANILIIDLNRKVVYQYKSEVYLEEIEKIYFGGASKNNLGFSGKEPFNKFNYDSQEGAVKLIGVLREKSWTKVHIDENCIVGWATTYYKTVPSARKEDFIGDETGKHKTKGEIRNPSVFKDFIYAYTGKSNVKFQYLMDKLNDTLQKKNLGAFYTPDLYAEKSLELVRKAIARVPQGNDYVIIDRCAGTGNLEKGMSDEELSHCILSTLEYYEYKVLQELLHSKVKCLIPPAEAEDTFNIGLVRGADALSEEYINNPIIREYLDNPKCTVILFENPPYAETTSFEHQKKGAGKDSSKEWKNSFVLREMKKEVKGSALNDLGNAFIWSAFKYYLRQPTDSYIVYSPVKYWKAQHLIEKAFLGGFAFNRRHFHTNIDACIMVALWANETATIEELSLKGFDITKENKLSESIVVSVKKINSLFSKKYYEKRIFEDQTNDGILIDLNGKEAGNNLKKRIKPIYSKNMLGYLVADSVGFDNPDAKSSLLVAGRYNGNGFYLHKDNYLEKLPLFCSSRYITYNKEWTERARIMKSADGAERYFKDLNSGKLDQYLRKCLLFTTLEMQNHMRSFTGSDKRFYRNELCLDITNGETIAIKDLQKLKTNEEEQKLVSQFEILMKAAKETKEYNKDYTYGVYQIADEIDTSYKSEDGTIIWNNPEVHSALRTLKELVKNYYLKEIVPTLFEYEFLK